MSPQVPAVLSAAGTWTPPGWAKRETQRAQESIQAEGAAPGLGCHRWACGGASAPRGPEEA